MSMKNENSPRNEQAARQEALDFARAEREARRVSSSQRAAEQSDAAARRASAQPRSAKPAPAKAAQGKTAKPAQARSAQPRTAQQPAGSARAKPAQQTRPAQQQKPVSARPAQTKTASGGPAKNAQPRKAAAPAGKPQQPKRDTAAAPRRAQNAAPQSDLPRERAGKPPKKPRGSRSRKVWIIVAVIVAALCVALLAGSLIVANRDTIFPKVTVNGTDVAGMTQEQAAETIRAAGWDDPDAAVLTIVFPGEETFAVSARETGFTATADEAAQAAWEYGRSGNILSNFFTYLRCAVSGKEMRDELSTGVDEAALRARVETEIGELNLDLSEGNIEIDEEESIIKVVKGASLITIDPEEVLSTILDALQQHQYGEVTYRVQSKDEADKVSMQELYDAVCTGPVNAGYDTETKEITEGKPGVEFDVAEAQRLWDAAAVGDTVRIPVTLTEPELESVAGLFGDKLATKTTSLSGSSYNRINNVKLAAQHIDGVILEPGDSFSYNQTVGQRTKANGFLEAGAYANGQVVQEVGGGICQVSSTLYYCTLISNLKITARTNHYFTVGYIEPGMDATVSWGAPDFQFKNNRTFPIKLRAYVSNGSLTVEIWGTDVDGSYVKMDYTVSGLTATTYRSVYDKNGNLLSKTQEATSVYHTHETPKPTPSPSPSATPMPTPSPAPTPTPDPDPTPSTPPATDPGTDPEPITEE